MKKLEQKIVTHLKTLTDSKYKEFHSNLSPGIDGILGIRVPILRNYAKELLVEYEVEELISISDDYYEEILLKGMVIGLQKEKTVEKVASQIQQFVPSINSWGICDISVAGFKIIGKNKEYFWDFIQSYMLSEKEYEVRFAVVVMLDYYVNDDYLQQIFCVVDKINHEGYYVKMAVAWLLSLCLIKYYDRTLEYLKVSSLDTFTYNKALQKARESYRVSYEHKEQLKKLKR